MNANMVKFHGRKGEKKFRNFRTTRVKIDVIMPIILSLIWIVFTGFSYMAGK